MLYGLESVAQTKIEEAVLEVAEMKMVRFSVGINRLDKIENKYIRISAHVM